ncbi:MAG TPA: nitroreductase family deazaflavin-dependent oxidoreductase [Candidatus Binataceae bacterium]|nr:nitroreductase family deazaflavin-dependent oxidoreductase [Candidatus Binataceae bacterium]
MDPSTAQRLAKIKSLQTIVLTHYGRKSGKPYDVVIWFVIEGERMFLGTANKSRNWVRNVMAKPNVVIKAGGENFIATVREIAEPSLQEHVMGLVQSKYWYAAPIMIVGRMLQNFGIITANTGAFEVFPQ